MFDYNAIWHFVVFKMLHKPENILQLEQYMTIPDVLTRQEHCFVRPPGTRCGLGLVVKSTWHYASYYINYLVVCATSVHAHAYTTEHTPQSPSHVCKELLKFKTHDLRGTPKLLSITSRFCMMSQRGFSKKAQFQDVAMSMDNLQLD